jgi:hypothetical protein
MVDLKNVLRPYKHKIKRSIISGIQFLPISSIYLGSPKSHYDSSAEYVNICNQNGLNNARYDQFIPPSIPQRNPPKSIYESNHWKFDEKYFHTVNPETFVVSVPNGRAVGNMGTIVTHDDKLLFDVSLQFGVGRNINLVKSHLAFNYLKLPKCDRIPLTIAVLATSGDGSYFHWLTDSLPRLEILKQTLPLGLESIDRFLVNKGGMSIIVESLKILNIPLEKVIFADRNTHIQAETLIVPSLPGNTGDSPLWVCKFLRNNFLQHKTDINPIGNKKLYISRSKAKYRRVTNEASVLECLSKYGFTPVYLEEYNFATQIAILSNAEVIVAPHGAGLTNLMWCNPGTKVLEIFSPNYINVCYWAIADRIGLDYFYLIGDGEKPTEYFDPHLCGDDISVSIADMRLSLDMILN